MSGSGSGSVAVPNPRLGKRQPALRYRLRPDPARAGLLLVDNHLIFQLPLGFEEISAVFSETSWLSMLMEKRGPLFSTTSWLRSDVYVRRGQGDGGNHGRLSTAFRNYGDVL